MPGEWKYGQTTFNSGSQTGTALQDKIATLLLGTGWEETTYSPALGTDRVRYFTRADHLTRDIWEFTGDGYTQKCGIAITNKQYNSGGNNGTDRVEIQAFLENVDGDAPYRLSVNNAATILVAWSPATVYDLLLIGGEDGLHLEMSTGGVRANAAHGAIMTHQVWDFLNGTRGPERKFSTQGIVMDFFGTIRFSADRSHRVVMNDGLNTNLTTRLRPYLVRGIDRILSSVSPVDDIRGHIGNFDAFLMSGFTSGSSANSSAGGGESSFCHFGLPFTPLDDRWRLSPVIFIPTDPTIEEVSLVNVSTSTSNNLTPSTAYTKAMPSRQIMRSCPRFVVAGHLLTPWQLITDTSTGIEYRIIQGDDNGRAFNLGIEWPGAGNVVTIP